MRTLTPAQTFCLGLPKYRTYVRVLVDNGSGTLVDLTNFFGRNWVKTVQWTESMDQTTATFTITLIREFYYQSLAPLVSGSMLNLQTGAYLPQIAVGRHIQIQTAVLPYDASPPQSSDWILSLDGYIDTHDPGTTDYEVQLTGRDLGGKVADRVAELSLTGGLTMELLETSMQNDVLNQIYTPIASTGSSGGSAPTLYTPTSPGWLIDSAFVLQPGAGCLDQLSQMAEQIGWDCRYLWSSVENAFVLTLWQPQRSPLAPSINETLQSWQITDAQSMQTDVSWVRNVVMVNYGQTSPPAGTVGGGAYLNPFGPIFVYSNASIAAYDRRFCAVGLGASSNILDSTHATTLANAVLSDLENPVINAQIDLMFRPEFMLGDYIQINPATLPGGLPWWDTEQQFGILGIQHEFDLPGDGGQDARSYTTLTLWAYPSGSIFDWQQAFSLNGASPPVKNNSPVAQTIASTQANIRGLGVTVLPPNQNETDWYETQLHVSTTSGFTPSLTTVVDRGKKTYFGIS